MVFSGGHIALAEGDQFVWYLQMRRITPILMRRKVSTKIYRIRMYPRPVSLKFPELAPGVIPDW